MTPKENTVKDSLQDLLLCEGLKPSKEFMPKMNYKIIQNLSIVYLYILLLFTHDFCHLSLYTMYNIYTLCIDIIYNIYVIFISII